MKVIRWVHTSLFWFLVVAILGILLRLYPITSLDIKYGNLLNAHSHIAFLGWIFTALFALIVHNFQTRRFDKNKVYQNQFRLLLFANGGMLISFLLQGYGPVSIAFSALHMGTSIWFAVTILKSGKAESDDEENRIAKSFLTAALSFMMLSSLGPLLLPLMSKFFGQGSAPYHDAIYFYLHFQYNGWFIFALLALFFNYLRKNKIGVPERKAKVLFLSLAISCALSYSLSTLWSDPPAWVWISGFVSALVQIVSLVALFGIVQQVKNRLPNRFIKLLFTFVLVLLTAKILLQFVSAFPLFAVMASSIRHFVIGYLHLVLLGIVTLSVIAFFISENWFKEQSLWFRMGLGFYLTGFIGTELMAFSEGWSNYFLTGIPNFYILQVVLSCFMLAGIICMVYSVMRIKSISVRKIYYKSPVYKIN